MAIRTSTATGNLSAGGSWVGGVAPTTGDQCIVANGHTITRDTALDLGVPCAQTPTTLPTISLATGASPTSLPSGVYQLRYTFVDAGGNESHPGANIGSGSIVNGTSQPRVTLPANPTGVSSKTLYLSEAGGAIGSEKLYASGITGTTTDLISASYTNGTTTYAAAAAWSNKAAIQINGGGHWVEGHASTLTARGDVIVGATSGISSWTCNAGGTLEFNAGSASSPSNVGYRLVLGNFSNFGTNVAKLLSSGTSTGSRYTIKAASGSAPARMGSGDGTFGAFIDSQFVDVEWVDLTDVGTSSVNSLRMSPSGQVLTCKWVGGKWTRCGAFDSGSPPTNSTVRFRNITTVDTVGQQAGTVTPLNVKGNSAIGTGERHIGGCCFDAKVYFTHQRDYTIGEITEGDGWGNVFYRNFSSIDANNAISTLGNFVRTTDPNDTAVGVAAVTARTYFLADFSGNNPHIFGSSRTVEQTIRDNVFEYTGSDDGFGDSILSMSGQVTYNIRNNIVTKNGDGTGTGTLVTMFQIITNQKIRVTHNTGWVSELAMIHFAESGPNAADHIDVVKSNLAVMVPGSTPGAQGPFVANDFGTSGVTDVMTPAGGTNNCFAGTPGTFGQGVVGNFYKGTFSTPPGVDDVALADAAAVGFVNGDARLAEWDESLGGTGTRAQKVAHALAEMMKRNDPSGYNTAFNINAAIDFIFAGHVPSNEALRAAGHDGEDIGAVAGAWPESTGARRLEIRIGQPVMTRGF